MTSESGPEAGTAEELAALVAATEGGDHRTAPRRRTKGERTKEHVAAVAAKLFARNGSLSVSLRDIASAAELTHAGLLHHFPGGKDEILMRVLEHRDAEDSVPLFDDNETARQHLDRIVGIVERNAETPGLVALYAKLSSEATDPDHVAHHYFTRRYEVIVEYLAQIFDALLPVPVSGSRPDPAVTARELIALMDGLQIQWLYAKHALVMREYVVDFLERLGIDTTPWKQPDQERGGAQAHDR